MWLLAWFACGVDTHAAPPAPLPVPAGFWDSWGDGRAELAGYRLTVPRYGELRHGEAVLVFVTETFTDATRVKSDGGHADTFPVMKLNDNRSFQTGIYDYDVQTSSWARLDGAWPVGRPAKVSMAMIEWCGQAYAQLVPRDAKALFTSHSYFDGEADTEVDLGWRAHGVHADLMPILARGIVGEWPPIGQDIEVDWLPTLAWGRLHHEPPRWGRATIRRGEALAPITVPAGTFDARTVQVTAPEGVATWWVEAAPPHRLLRWERDDGEVGELTGSARMPYWQRQAEGDEALRAELGLPPARR